MKLLERTYEDEIDRVTGQSVAGNCETRHTFALDDFKPHPYGARKNNICCDTISDAKAKIVGSLWSVNLKTKAINQTLRMPRPRMSKRRRAFQQSHNLATL